jgi:long-chain acyl-CoA synthetase
VTVVRGEALVIAPDRMPASVVELVHRTVERHPDKEALRWKSGTGWASWTYAQLWEQIALTSIGLHEMGLAAGDRVVILSRSRPEWVVADLACLALGVVTCPIYPADPPSRMAHIAREVDARFLFVEDDRLLQRLRAGFDDGELRGSVVLFDATETVGPPSLAAVAGRATGAARAAWDASWRSVQPEHVATVVHTIGTDGIPLGVVVRHGNLVHSFHAIVQAVPISSADVLLSVLPMSHMFERGASILSALGVGATVAFADRQLERWGSDMATVQPTMMPAIPLFFERIERRTMADLEHGPGFRQALFGWALRLGRQHYQNHLAGRPDGRWLLLQRAVAARTVTAPLRRALGGRLRYFMSGGAPLPESTGLFFEAVGIPILEGYGLTETAPILTANRPASYRYGSVGTAVAGTELRIDPVTGEIQARGPQVMDGYLDRPSATARALDPDGWLSTGDVGEFDEAGRLRITGRLKNLLVMATGKNVAPGPIERAVEASPYIRQAVLLGDNRDATGILVVPDLDRVPMVSAADEPAMAALLRQEVERLTGAFASYERPRRTVVLPRPLDVDRGEVDMDGRPVRAVVLLHFAAEVEELFDRLGDTRRSTAEGLAPDATPEHQPKPTVSAPG